MNKVSESTIGNCASAPKPIRASTASDGNAARRLSKQPDEYRRDKDREQRDENRSRSVGEFALGGALEDHRALEP